MAYCKYRPLLIGFILALVCVAVFGEVCRHSFVAWDDEINVYHNPYLNPPSLAHTGHFWRSVTLGPGVTAYRPVVYSVYAAIACFAVVPMRLNEFGPIALDPMPFHVVNLGIHILNVLLVFGLLRSLTHGHDWAAGTGAALFAFHPAQVESVAWVTGLTDLLGATFSLLALGLYLRWAGGGKWTDIAAAAGCFVLALLSKPTAVTLPLIAAAIDYFFLGRSWHRWIKPLSLGLLLSMLTVGLTHIAEHVTLTGVVTSWYLRPLIAGDALAFYCGKLLWPVHLGIDYGRSPSYVLAASTLWLTALAPIMLGAGVLVLRKQAPWLAAAILLFVLALLPVLGLVPFRFQTYSTVADRYLYLALLGPALALAAGFSRLPKTLPHRSLLAVGSACGLVLILFCFGSALQVTTWQNSYSMFQSALETNPKSWMAHYNLGILLSNRGDETDARPHFLEAVRLKPEYAAE